MKKVKTFLISGVLFLLATGAQAETLKVMNWNVLYGFNHQQSIDEGAEWLKSQDPDVVALQELNGISEERLGELSKQWGHAYAVTHKSGGFPVGLTSNQPIQVLEREVEGFHHGYLHARTAEIHFFVVHFWPGKYHEADHIIQKALKEISKGNRVIILGDFNGCSRRDEAFLKVNATLREHDYTFTDKLEKSGWVDIVAELDPDAKISCPSPITIPRWTKDLEELRKKQYRIDFIFTDKQLTSKAISAGILTLPVIDTLSDHYPVFTVFEMEESGDLKKHIRFPDI